MHLQRTSPGSQLSVAIVGAGQVARHHVQAFSQLGSGVRIVGIADIALPLAQELAATCGADAFQDYRSLLELRPDIAVICLPHHLHREAGLAAAAAGSHVLMEKPLAHTTEDALAIVETCRQHGRLLTVSYVHRYRLEYQEAARLIREGAIGRPVIGLDCFSFPGGTSVPGWTWRKEHSGGGVLMYTGIHAIDRLRWLFNAEIESVYARAVTYSQDVAVEDGVTATLNFAGGSVGTLFENSPDHHPATRFWETWIYGTAGSLQIRAGEYVACTGGGRAFRTEVSKDDWFLAQARDFADCVREERQPWITGEDGLRSLAVAMAIYQSAARGEPVAVPGVGQTM